MQTHYSNQRYFLNSPQIQKPTVSSQKSEILGSQRVNYPTCVERKQMIQPCNHRPRVQPRAGVKSGEVTKQNKYYSLQETYPIYHSRKPQNYPEIHFLDPPQK